VRGRTRLHGGPRAWPYGLAAGREAGVDRAIEILVKEIDITLRLLGRTRLEELGRHCLLGAPGDLRT
jgi:isopentenyl diphosphate isomerase/L-lactate dehydrogenase-like FMN-dependent dehydrogenase